MSDASYDNYVAVVGMACRFPGARNLDEFWQLLSSGTEARQSLSDEDLRAAGVDPSLIADPNYVKSGMFMHDVELFDGEFFGFSDKESAILDPQHRHFLECCWEAIEHAGYDVDRIDSAVGVFAGSGHNAYMPYNLLSNPELVKENGMFLLRHTGNDKDFLTTRVSYLLNLTGPSINVATACSTSLVSTHMACQSLLSGECDMALAGGSTIEMPLGQGYLYKDGEVASPDGHCRPFDINSAGTCFGSGVGVVVLKRVQDALDDNDDILAVVRGSAVNNDGFAKMSYLAPSIDGQAACVAEAIEIADIDAQSISYVEAHGTGTPIGDPIEVAALTRAYGESADRDSCGIGSVKSNIGHTDTAAGVAALIKTVLSLQHKKIPATLNFQAPNPAIDLERSPFRVISELTSWVSEGPRRAGINSLGVGGTNAHVIIEEANEFLPKIKTVADQPAHRYQLLPVSARHSTALSDYLSKLADHCHSKENVSIADLAYTLQSGRRVMSSRATVVCPVDANVTELFSDIEDTLAEAVCAPKSEKEVVFLFAGGGAQYPNMGLELYEHEPEYRDAIEACLDILQDLMDYDLKALLFPMSGDVEAASIELRRPSRTIPALFITQYAQAKLWLSWGIKPAAMLGHSMGENTAACIAGVFDLKDALALVTLRGRLFEKTQAGSMLGVTVDETTLRRYLADDTAVACINAPEFTVASGPVAAIDKLAQQLTLDGIDFSKIHIDVAAHSPMLDPILGEFEDFLRSIKLHTPNITFASNVTGTWISDEQATNPEYWVDHLRNTVRFSEGLSTVLTNEDIILLEVGPGRTLNNLAQMHPDRKATFICHSMPTPEADIPAAKFMTEVLGALWQQNALINWDLYHSGRNPSRLHLPTYPFQHKYHWIEPGRQIATHLDNATSGNVSLAQAQYSYQTIWQPHTVLSEQPTSTEPRRLVLLICHEQTQIDTLRQLLSERYVTVVVAATASAYAEPQGNNEYQFRANVQNDYARLIKDINDRYGEPDAIFHTLGITPAISSHDAYERRLQGRGLLDSVLYLSQALSVHARDSYLDLVFLATQGFSLAGEPADPNKALLWGPLPVVNAELDKVGVRYIDLPQNSQGPSQLSNLLTSQLLTTLTTDASGKSTNRKRSSDPVFVLRGNKCFTRAFVPHKGTDQIRDIRLNTTVLITGGTGDLGLAAANQLAKPGICLALLSRSRFLPEDQWTNWLANHGTDDLVSQKIHQLQELQEKGAKLVLLSANIANYEQSKSAIDSLIQSHGAISGVIHTAGHLEDSLIVSKNKESIDRVLEAKFQGTLVLDQIFKVQPLDFFVLYSSISAHAGAVGQFDYSAANAFQISYADTHQRPIHKQVVAIGWSAWQEIGMAAKQGAGEHYHAPPTGNPCAHPLLDYRLDTPPEIFSCGTTLTAQSHWVIDEHRLQNNGALMPGSGFLELAIATFAECATLPICELEDVEFIVALEIPETGRVDVITTLAAEQNGHYSFKVESTSKHHRPMERSLHCTGRIRESEARLAPSRANLSEMRNRCTGSVQTFTDPDHHPFMIFGDHWAAMRSVNLGDREAIIELNVAAAQQSELDEYYLQPALIDMATAGAQALIPGYLPTEHFYVPMEYSRVKVFGKTSAIMTSHVRLNSQTNTDNDIAIFNIDLFDESGVLVVAVEDFSMRLIEHDQLGEYSERESGSSGVIEKVLELGISPQEGAEILSHILNSGVSGAVAIAKSQDGPQHVIDRLSAISNPSRTKADAVSEHDFSELDAVAQELVEHPSIAQAIVRKYGRATNQHIVAHIVFATDEYATNSELRKYLKSKVRTDFVPQHYNELDLLPLDANGEVDRTVLKDPIDNGDFEPPQTETEKSIAAIWQSLLGISELGRHENFFDIGGHSILSIRAIAAIEKQLGVRINQKIMVLQTLEQIAAEVAAKQSPIEDGTDQTDGENKGIFRRMLGR